jgi:putative toxin-antitoxin system antitoxin component (TIGR02293 family)
MSLQASIASAGDPRFADILPPVGEEVSQEIAGQAGSSILAQAVQVFGDLPNAESWLAKPTERSGNRKPSEMLQTEAGRHQVEGLLGQIDEGRFA